MPTKHVLHHFTKIPKSKSILAIILSFQILHFHLFKVLINLKKYKVWSIKRYMVEQTILSSATSCNSLNSILVKHISFPPLLIFFHSREPIAHLLQIITDLKCRRADLAYASRMFSTEAAITIKGSVREKWKVV